MARIEKTVFISYRRKDISWALAVYQYLTSQKYDVFFDYTSIPSGDFEQIIVSNIRARAHFVLILTPTSLDRCSEPGDWLRREIETAIDEKRNIIPLFFDGFSFGSPAVKEKLTGKLATLNRYNGLEIPSGYFLEAMERLRRRYLNVRLNAVLHPIPTEVLKVVNEEKVAADEALKQREDIKELVKAAEERQKEHETTSVILREKAKFKPFWKTRARYLTGGAILLIAIIGFLMAINSLQSLFTVVPSQADGPLSIGSTMISPKDNMVMVYVPEGESMMGSDNGSPEERPAHTVKIDAFWIDQTEVSNAMFSTFLNSMGNQSDDGVTYLDINDEDVHIYLNGDEWLVDAGFEQHPVIEISWFGAQAYCSWAGGRLPTEAEWEKAASWNDLTKTKYVYPWGDDFACTNGNFDDETQTNGYVVPGGESCDGFARTSPVGSFPIGASPYGLLDMAGNVWEWVADWYDENYYTRPASPNPPGPESGRFRVIRGGSWLVNDFEIRTAYRYRYDPLLPSGNIGFRCTRSE
jgi:formylglycine-generating enzyme required for sulfatase activity